MPDPPRHLHRAGLYLQALWGEHEPLLHGSGMEVPRLEPAGILIPECWREDADAGLLHRAAACHAAAHRRHGGAAWETGELRPRQQALIGLVEDARVEALAMARFPGLRVLWARYHPPVEDDTLRFPVLMRRLARSLLLGEDDGNPWVRKGVQLFQTQAAHWTDPELSRDIGLRLAHDLGQMRIAMDEGRLFTVARYRDDNRHLWVEYDTLADTSGDAAETDEMVMPPEGRFLREDGRGLRFDLDESPGPPTGTGGAFVRESTSDQAVLEYRSPRETQSVDEWRYPEWHHRIQLLRRDWCRVQEQPAPEGDVTWAERVRQAHCQVLARMRRVAEGLRLERWQRARRQEDGDELDCDALVRARLAIHRGLEPDPRLYYRVRPLHDRGLASLVLLDLSESVNAPAPETGCSRLELTREAALLLGLALEPLGEAFALHGFRSCGRHRVEYFRLKSFDERFDAHCLSRIAGLEAGLSTRLGAAVRHASAQLARRSEQRRLLLVVTDGDPSDIDVHDPDHLPLDARHAVQEARGMGVQVFCLCLEPGADLAVRRMFGVGRYRMLDHLARLPDLLPQLLLTLVRHY